MMSLKDWLANNEKIIEESEFALRVKKVQGKNQPTVVDVPLISKQDAIALFGDLELRHISPMVYQDRLLLLFIVRMELKEVEGD